MGRDLRVFGATAEGFCTSFFLVSDLNTCVLYVRVRPAPVSSQGSNVKERAGPKWPQGVVGVRDKRRRERAVPL